MTTEPAPAAATPKLKVTDVVEGRANSITGNSEIEFAHADGKVILQMDPDMLFHLINMAVRLQRVPPPVQGEVIQLRAFPIAWWTLGRTPDNREVVQTFELKDGGHIGFRMELDMAGRLAEMLRETLAGAAR